MLEEEKKSSSSRLTESRVSVTAANVQVEYQDNPIVLMALREAGMQFAAYISKPSRAKTESNTSKSRWIQVKYHANVILTIPTEAEWSAIFPHLSDFVIFQSARDNSFYFHFAALPDIQYTKRQWDELHRVASAIINVERSHGISKPIEINTVNTHNRSADDFITANVNSQGVLASMKPRARERSVAADLDNDVLAKFRQDFIKAFDLIINNTIALPGTMPIDKVKHVMGLTTADYQQWCRENLITDLWEYVCDYVFDETVVHVSDHMVFQKYPAILSQPANKISLVNAALANSGKSSDYKNRWLSAFLKCR